MAIIRKMLFKGMQGCSNHGCVIRGKFSGMGTNGSCGCLVSMSRGELNLLQARINAIADKEIKE